ncbi:MAG: glutamine-hydrolyzing carbamoyl-phosphate synthase small subunit [Pseudomonadota bacterium]
MTAVLQQPLLEQPLLEQTTPERFSPHRRLSCGATALLMLEGGDLRWGIGIGAEACEIGELCFNTAMTGYQEIMTDPSYAGQIINFTFPHIGNVGANDQDYESKVPHIRGCVLAFEPSLASNYRSRTDLNSWLANHGIPGIAGIDSRALTRRIRDHGAINAALAVNHQGQFDLAEISDKLGRWKGLEGVDMAYQVSCQKAWTGRQGSWQWPDGFGQADQGSHGRPCKVVAIDYGIKYAIVQQLTQIGCQVEVVPAQMPAAEILARKPDGVFLSNGPADPAATIDLALETIRQLLASEVAIFGICLGHQLLALALGCSTRKMHTGHHGANHPVFDYTTGKVEITSQNHGFVVDEDRLAPGVEITHRSLFDQSIAGFALSHRPVFGVQYHPEASPGPQDSHYLFKRFVDLMQA